MSPPITFERADEIKRCYDSALTLTGSRIHKKFLNFIYSIKSYCWGGTPPLPCILQNCVWAVVVSRF